MPVSRGALANGRWKRSSPSSMAFIPLAARCRSAIPPTTNRAGRMTWPLTSWSPTARTPSTWSGPRRGNGGRDGKCNWELPTGAATTGRACCGETSPMATSSSTRPADRPSLSRSQTRCATRADSSVTSVTLPAASGAVLHRRYVKPTAAATGALEVAGNASAEEALSEPTPGSETGLLPVLPAPGAALPGEAASFVPAVNEASTPVPSPQPSTVAPKRAAAPGHAKPHRKRRRRRVKRRPPRRSRGAKVGLIHSASRQPG